MSAHSIPEPRLPNPKRQLSLSADHGPFLMKHTFEHAELSDGVGSGEQGKERSRDETGREWMTEAVPSKANCPIRAKTLSECRSRARRVAEL